MLHRPRGKQITVNKIRLKFIDFSVLTSSDITDGRQIVLREKV